MDSLFDQSVLISLAERLIKAARAAGADSADAVAMRSVSQSVEVRDGAVEESERSEGDDMGLRVMLGKRQAVVSTNDLNPEGVKALAERAVAMARVAPEDKYAGLADPALLAKNFPNLDLVDRELPDTAALETMAKRAEEAGKAVKGVSKSGGASASAGIGGMVLLTSHGFAGSYLGSRHGVSMQAIAGEGTGMETDYDFSSALHAADLDNPEKIGRTAGEKAVARLNPRKVSTRKVPVIFDWSVAGSIVGHLVSAINGAAIARKTSFLKDKLGERLFASGINIIDDPLRVRGLRSRPFDAEGVAGRRMALVEDGVLKTWLLDSATARELGMASTGHAQRSASSTPSPGATNLHLEPGSVGPDDLMKDIREGFYVTDLIGSGANMVTGDYSRGAAGFWIENGERTYPVSEVTIAGSLLDIFRSLVPANDLRFRYGTNAPTVRLEGLTVAGVCDLTRDRDRLAMAVQAAGEIALKFFKGPLKQWTKGAGDSPVTEADIASNDLLQKLLVEPGDGWLSEESENDPARLQARRVWVIDPIDGTRAFIAGRDDWSVSAALAIEGRPAVAALFAPATGELFVATAGGGATLNAAPIMASGGAGFDGIRMGGPKRILDKIAEGSGIVPMPRIHSLALRLARVAQGTLDAALAGGNGHDWDLAAADLLVHEAGGLMTALDGTALIYNRPDPVHGMLLAAGRERHAALGELVRAQIAAPA